MTIGIEQIPLLDLRAQYHNLEAEIHAALERVLTSQQFILGPEVEDLEQKIAEYSQCKYGTGVSSGTDALLIALMAIGIQPGEEVIVPAYSFVATASSVSRLGAKPVFVDIYPGTLNINIDQVERVITEKTRAIIPVHLGGQVADMQRLLELSNSYGLQVIEDAAQAIGSEYFDKRAGSMGKIGCFSFFPSKNLGGYGDSGMVVTNDDELAERLILLRNHGHQPKYYSKLVGGNFRMDALQAAVLSAKFSYLDEWIMLRREHAAVYRSLFIDSGLAHSDGGTEFPVSLPKDSGFGRHTYHLYMIRAEHRDSLMAYLKQNQIGCEVYYPVPLHLQECFRELGYQPGDMPESELASRQTLAIPVYPELTLNMQEKVVSTIANFYAGKKWL
jgi:dTDP-4-amino-4,6-dideoxygalactose transaminase